MMDNICSKLDEQINKIANTPFENKKFKVKEKERKRCWKKQTTDIKAEFYVAEILLKLVCNNAYESFANVHYGIGNKSKRNAEAYRYNAEKNKYNPYNISLNRNMNDKKHSEICKNSHKEWNWNLHKLDEFKLFS